MAKVTNETKLVLKLAEERSDTLEEKETKGASFPVYFISGFRKGIIAYKDLLQRIVGELEQEEQEQR